MKKGVLFLLTVMALTAGLMLLNWIPRAIGGRGIQTHTGFGSLPHELAVAGVYRPSFFPETLLWPPDEILTRENGLSLIMHFSRRGRRQIDLSISQSMRAADLIPSRIDPYNILSQRTMPFRGHRAHITVGTCRDGSPCNRILWYQDGTTLSVVYRGPEQDLLRIAQSLIPEQIR